MGAEAGLYLLAAATRRQIRLLSVRPTGSLPTGNDMRGHLANKENIWTNLYA